MHAIQIYHRHWANDPEAVLFALMLVGVAILFAFAFWKRRYWYAVVCAGLWVVLRVLGFYWFGRS